MRTPMGGIATNLVTQPPISQPLPPRILLVMPDQWTRALLRAALRDVGYDAVGTRTIESALRIPVVDPARGAVRLIIIDQPALSGASDEAVSRLLARHGTPATLLLVRAMVTPPEGPWQHVLRRPVSVADIVSAVATLLPLLPSQRHPLE